MTEKLRATLRAMEENGIIRKADRYCEWVSHIVIVEKRNSSLRICLDPAELNRNIRDENYLLPTLSELTSKLIGAKYYTVLDIKDGFWHVESAEESRSLCAFATPFGNHEFNRMPFGIKTGPQVFQRKNEENFGDIENVSIYIDDILIVGKTRQEHDRVLIEVLERAVERNVKFNATKIQIAVESVKYLGHIFSQAGIRPDEDRIVAIAGMKDPANKKDLQKFLGVANYMQSFIPNLSETTATLRELLKKNAVFNWTENHSHVVERIKNLIVESPILKPFDENKNIEIQTDASKSGLGCCMWQDGCPISFASRSLTSSEQAYSQIEKEFLAIIFACKKIHYYAYGRTVKVVSDHKPLLSIMKKEIHKVPSAKLQRIRLKLLNYDIVLEFAPGTSIHIADYLSRYFRDTDEPEEDKTITEAVLTINVSDDRKVEFQTETDKDSVLRKIKMFCRNGWPNQKGKCDEDAKFFYRLRDELMVEDDIIFYKDRIVVPASMKTKILGQLHESHLGIVKTKKRAKELLYWPGMYDDIENIVSKCFTCQSNRGENQKEPLIAHEIPCRPFEKLGCDIMEFKGKNYLVIVDYYSKWIELKQLRGKRAQDVNLCWLEAFTTFGIPKIIIADNMPFDSYECRKFAEQFDFFIETSSPHYPKSNGLAERAVQICKNKLPGHVSKFKSKVNENVEAEQKMKTENSKKYYDAQAKQRDEFNVNDTVFMRLSNKWVPGRITQKWHTPRSYVVVSDGTEYRRNSRDIRSFTGDISQKKSATRVNPPSTIPPDEEDQAQHRTRSGKIYKRS